MAHVKLILLEDVETLGLAGTQVSVAPGYARNYLLPRKKAVPVTPGAERMFAARKEKIEAQRQEKLAAVQALADKLNALVINFTMEAAADESLFGSISTRTLTESLKKQGFEIEHTKIQLAEPIKHLGAYDVPVRLNATVSATFKVEVIKA